MATATGARAAPPNSSLMVGRDRELVEVRGLLSRCRLVTITGPGGVGKTCLARAVIADHVEGDVAVCRLAPVPSPAGVPTAMAEALGFASLAATAVGIDGRVCLLLVDNAEHHLDAVASAVSDLLASCSAVTVLVTSQEPLDLPEEQVVVLDGLPVPPGNDPMVAATSPAVELFLARARSAGVDLPPDPRTASTVATICRRLDGLPLAIELAAARARTLAPDDILRHLDARFALLTRRHDRGPARHRSLAATIDWSFERLDPATQRFFARLGAFCGPFGLEAAHTVAAEPGDAVTTTVDRLDGLVHRSLVTVADQAGAASFVLPESLRLYARLQLGENGEEEACDERCVDHHVRLAVDLTGRASRTWSTAMFQTLLGSQLDLQDAIRWCLARDAEADRATALFIPLWGLVHNGRAEPVYDLGRQVLRRWPDAQDVGWATVAAITGTAALVTGDVEVGRDLATRSLAVADTGLGAVMAGRAAFMAALHRGEVDRGLAHLDRAIDVAGDAALEPFLTELLVYRALTHARLGDHRRATAAATDAGRRADAGDSELLQVVGRLGVGAIVAMRDPGVAARAVLVEALEIATRIGYPWGIGTSHRMLGAVALLADDVATARSHLELSLEAFLDVGQLGEVATTLAWVGALLARTADADRAASVIPSRWDTPGAIDALEHAHLERLLTGVPTPPLPRDLRAALVAARTALETMPGPVAMVEGGPEDPAAAAGAAQWLHEGAMWALTYDATTVRLPEAKGLMDLAVLLSQPGREVAATALMATAVDSGDLGPVIDTTARRAYERRIIDLQEDLEEAEEFGDLARADRARTERDHLVDMLTASTGLGGRSRRTGDSAERARSAVTRRIRDAIRRLDDIHPSLGDHLSDAVRTGKWCAYEPRDGVAWTIRLSRSVD